PASQPTHQSDRDANGAVWALAQIESSADSSTIIAQIDASDVGFNENRLFKSEDNGKSWSWLGETLPPFPVQAVAISPNYAEDETLFVGLTLPGETGGLYKSTDGGKTWSAAMTGLQDLWVSQLFISPDFAEPVSNTLFSGSPTSRLIFADTTHAGLHVSTDAGETWEPVAPLDPNNPLVVTNQSAVVIDPNGSVLVSQFQDEMQGVFRATVELDGSLSTWEPVLDSWLSLLAFAPDGQTAFGFGSGLWRSTDGGQSWEAGGMGLLDLDKTQAKQFLFSPDFIEDQTVYLFLQDIQGSDSGRLYRSTDGGEQWQLWRSPPGGKRYTSISLTDDGDFLLGDQAATVTQLSSTALIWRNVDAVSELFPINDFVVSPDFATDQTLFATSNVHGVFKSTDGGQQWDQTNYPVRSTSFEGYRISLSPNYGQDQTVYVSTGFSVHRSQDGGDSWESLQLDPTRGSGFNALKVIISPNFKDDGTLLASTNAGVARSTDRGDTWQPVMTRPDDAGAAQVFTFDATTGTAYTWFDYNGTLFTSRDAGKTWEENFSQQESYFTIAATDISPQGLLIVHPAYTNQLIQVSNQGRNQRIFDNSLPATVGDLQTLAYGPDQTLYVAGSDNLFKSQDDGQTWQDLNQGLFNARISQIHPTATNIFIVDQSGGIFVSVDDGRSWENVSLIK
ncbi:MAG: YCF48-related protein, partial [Chloroflexota bacterium]